MRMYTESSNSMEKLDGELAPYAMLNRNSGDRIHPESKSSHRSPFQRDRDRLVHSKAFRRLGYKTQVFVNSEGDNYRTRLTHSLEVSQISRSIAGALGLNQEYTEALALAHDLGHTPFGHAGQEALNLLMKDYGGFEHNCQSLRIIMLLENRYIDHPGLNLTRSTLKGIMKHGCTPLCPVKDDRLCQERNEQGPSLEAALVDQCDRLAYLHHDLEDGMDSGYLHYEDLQELDIWKKYYRQSEDRYGSRFTRARIPLQIRTVVRDMMNDHIEDLIQNIKTNIEKHRPETLQNIYELREKGIRIILFSESISRDLKELESYLTGRLYRNPGVIKMSRRGARIIETLFHEYLQTPEMMPAHVQERKEEEGLERTVCDYIAGMTDRYALKEYSYITGLNPVNP